jgi:hypothetical protein
MNQNSVKTKSVPPWHVCDRNTCTQSTSKDSKWGGPSDSKSLPGLISEATVVKQTLPGTVWQAALQGLGQALGTFHVWVGNSL